MPSSLHHQLRPKKKERLALEEEDLGTCREATTPAIIHQGPAMGSSNVSARQLFGSTPAANLELDGENGYEALVQLKIRKIDYCAVLAACHWKDADLDLDRKYFAQEREEEVMGIDEPHMRDFSRLARAGALACLNVQDALKESIDLWGDTIMRLWIGATVEEREKLWESLRLVKCKFTWDDILRKRFDSDANRNTEDHPQVTSEGIKKDPLCFLQALRFRGLQPVQKWWNYDVLQFKNWLRIKTPKRYEIRHRVKRHTFRCGVVAVLWVCLPRRQISTRSALRY